MDERYKGLEGLISLQGLLGYLNFAGGKTDARFQKQVSDAYGFLAKKGADEMAATPTRLRRRVFGMRTP